MRLTATQTSVSSHLQRPVLTWAVLVFATVAVQLISLFATSSQTLGKVWLPSALIIAAISAPLAALGLRLGSSIGLGAPLLSAMLTLEPGAGRRLMRQARLAILLGLSLGAILWALRIASGPLLPPELPALGHRGVGEGLAVSLGAAVAEEVWLRLGVMTLIAWLIMRLSGRALLTPAIAWSAILLAAVAFAAIHLPQLASYGAASQAGMLATMSGNVVVGVFYGWLYWRHSLVAAMIGHFSVDLVLYVVTAVLN